MKNGVLNKNCCNKSINFQWKLFSFHFNEKLKKKNSTGYFNISAGYVHTYVEYIDLKMSDKNWNDIFIKISTAYTKFVAIIN